MEEKTLPRWADVLVWALDSGRSSARCTGGAVEGNPDQQMRGIWRVLQEMEGGGLDTGAGTPPGMIAGRDTTQRAFGFYSEFHPVCSAQPAPRG